MRFLLTIPLAAALVLGAALAQAADADKPETMWDLMKDKYDANKDGVIHKTEYTRSDKAFAACDRNDDGVLTSADFRRPPALRPRAPRASQDARPRPPGPRGETIRGERGPRRGPPRMRGHHMRDRGPRRRGPRDGPPRPPHAPKPPKGDSAPPPPPPSPPEEAKDTKDDG